MGRHAVFTAEIRNTYALRGGPEWKGENLRSIS
jgi:hypothetical protein